MGLFDFLKGTKSAGDTSERSLLKHAERVLDKRAMSPERFGSIDFLSRAGTAEAWRSLLPRFNFNVDPTITDREEKQFILDALRERPENAIEPVREYLRTAPSLTWPIRMLKSIESPEAYVADLVAYLATFDTGYERFAEHKAQIIAALEDESDPTIVAAVLPFLRDFSEDVRFHAIRTLVAQRDASVVDPLVAMLLEDSSFRIRSTVVEGLAEGAWPIDEGARGAVAALLPAVPNGPWRIDAGKIARVGG